MPICKCATAGNIGSSGDKVISGRFYVRKSFAVRKHHVTLLVSETEGFGNMTGQEMHRERLWKNMLKRSER